MVRQITEAQKRLLETLPTAMSRFERRRGFPHMLGNPTVHALLDRGFIEVATIPPRWRITPSGRAALKAARRSN